MNTDQFVQKYYPFALEVEKETNIPAVAVMAQAALESAWGKKAIGNNLFGIKFRKGDHGFMKVLTTEYSSSPNEFRGKDVKSVVYDRALNKYKYKIYCYFAGYESPGDCFKAHARLLMSDRYILAQRWLHSPKRFLIAVWRCGYATDPNYGKKMCQMVDAINRRL